MKDDEEQTIDLATLSVEQLLQLRKQVEGDLKTLANNIGTLKMAHERYTASLEAVQALAGPSQPLLVPLSSSMYIPGRTTGDDKVMIDIGTGFFVRLPCKQAQGILQRKIDYVARNIGAFTQQLENQRETLQRIVAATQRTIQQQSAAGPTKA